MKYLKEGKWEDFYKNLKDEYSTIDANKELHEAIGECMVDIEEYHKSEYLDSNSNIYRYIYTIPSKSVSMIIDIKEKLDDVIGTEGYRMVYTYNLDGRQEFGSKINQLVLIKKDILINIGFSFILF